MKKIKVKFVDFWDKYIPEQRTIFKCLKRKYEVILSDKPDYLFYGNYGSKHLYYSCIKIYIATECIAPDFNICDYAIGYHKINFGDRYMYYPASYEEGYKQSIRLMHTKSMMTLDDLRKKTGFCSFVVSNGLNADPYRKLLLDKLNQYKEVASGGKYQNNIGDPVKDKNAFQRNYKFSVACENMSSPGYVTEKIIESFAANTIPIYWGDPLVGEIYNEYSFINCNKFQSIDDVIQEIQRLDNDDNAYLEMINKSPLVHPDKWTYKARCDALLSFLSNIFEGGGIQEAKRISFEASNKQYVQLLRDWASAYQMSPIRIKRRIESIKVRKYWH